MFNEMAILWPSRFFYENTNVIICFFQIYQYLCFWFNLLIAMEDINRLKIVLVEKRKTGKWLAEQLGKNPSTVSKWCSNVAQPDLATLVKISTLLEVDVQNLIVSSTIK